MSHPGHPPVPSASTAISEWRALYNAAHGRVKTYPTVITASTTLDLATHGTHVLVDATAGAVVLSLPDPTADPDHVDARFTIKRIDGSINAVTVDPVGTPTIDGAASRTILSQWGAMTVWNKGSDWYRESVV